MRFETTELTLLFALYAFFIFEFLWGKKELEHSRALLSLRTIALIRSESVGLI